MQHVRLTVEGLTFAGHRDSSMPLIQISDQNPKGELIARAIDAAGNSELLPHRTLAP